MAVLLFVLQQIGILGSKAQIGAGDRRSALFAMLIYIAARAT